MKLSLLAGNTGHRGPGGVYQNLYFGLSIIGGDITVYHNQGNCDFYGYLQDIGPVWQQLDPNKTLFGPNVFVLPSDNKALCNHAKHFVVPSEWVKNLYEQFPEMTGKKIHIWSAGIDTKSWKPNPTATKDLDCFIYFKNREQAELDSVKSQLSAMGLKYETISYGNYHEDALKELCKRAKFAILLTGTESQGLAYMQILSSNVPCYALNKTTWTSDDGKVTVPASSVPYFSDDCGIVVDNLDCSRIIELQNKLSTYKPREYILKEHGFLEKAKAYAELIKNL